MDIATEFATALATEHQRASPHVFDLEPLWERVNEITMKKRPSCAILGQNGLKSDLVQLVIA